MNNKVRVTLAVSALILSACTTTRQFSDVEFKPPTGAYRLIVVQPDISVSVLTAGGMLGPREDWTNQARDNVIRALVAQEAGRGGNTKIAATADDTGADAVLVADLVRLHKAVGQTIVVHKYSGQTLPTKKKQFDWTLGEPAVQFGALSMHDYALFLHAEDSFSSDGRIAVQVAAVLACAAGVCIWPTGGQQGAFASLVDLKTGKVVWFNMLSSTVGDIRTPEGAEKMVSRLLGKMKPGSVQQAASKKT